MQVLQEQKPVTHLTYIRVGKFQPTTCYLEAIGKHSEF